jgi:1-acyl-sn-glycerol-3-phosphate acyltransferase
VENLSHKTSREQGGLRNRAMQRLSQWDALRPRALAQSLLSMGKSRVETFMTDRLGEEFSERLRRVPTRTQMGSSEVDVFGLDPEWTKYALASVAFLHRSYFRSVVRGISNLPSGRVLLVANHGGQIPLDGAMIGASLFMDAEPPRLMRAMVEKWSQTLPFVSLLFSRVGQVPGLPENARRLLENEEALLVFPEGTKGICKTFDRRYNLGDFGLGFMRLAMETRTPIVPVAVVGAEEQYVSVGNLKGLANALGMPAFPILPQLLLPFGFLPLPVRYRITFGEPLEFHGDPDDEDAVLAASVDQVKQAIARMLEQTLRQRESVFF